MIGMENSDYILELTDGLFYFQFKKNTVIDYKLARYLVETRKRITRNEPFLMLFNGDNITNVTKDARDFFASKEATDGIIAGAFIVNSPLTVVLSNFFITISKPKKPAKLFTDKAEAIKWLRAFQNEQKKIIAK